MSMVGHLEERAAQAEANRKQADRDAYARASIQQAQKPEARLVAFDRWLLIEMDARLDWKWAGNLREKRMHQCRIQIDGMIIALWRRGFMLDGRRLADRVIEMLDAIGKAQRGGQVRDFWPYFKASVSRYVGLNAEEIQAEAMSAGQAVGAVFQQLTRRLPAGPSLPELVAQRAEETLRAKVSRQRAQEAQKAADRDQLPLL
jgi:hypothetical protein